MEYVQRRRDYYCKIYWEISNRVSAYCPTRSYRGQNCVRCGFLGIAFWDHRQNITEGERIGERGFIPVRANFSSERVSGAAGLPTTIRHRSVKFYPAADPCTVMKIAGVYVPPSSAGSGN